MFKHSTIDQIHKTASIIEKSLEKKKVSSNVCLDVTQAFDQIWHKGIIHKFDSYLPKHFTDILQSYPSIKFSE